MVANLKDLEAGDIQDTDEVLTFVLRVQRLVDTCYQPREHFSVQSLGQSCHRVHNLNTYRSTVRTSG